MSEKIVERKEYQGYIKNSEGEIETVDLESKRFVTEPEPIDLESLLVRKAAPTIIRASRRKTPPRSDALTVAMGDTQIGYRAHNNELEPFHDERAMALGVLAVRQLMPDNIVLTGDMIDLPAMSRYEQRADWVNQTQVAIDRYHQYLAELKAEAPNARIVVVHGNHEMRVPNSIQKNMAEVLNLRRASMVDELAVLSLRYLVRYDDLGVESHDGYPNADFWLEDNLRVTHGTHTKKGGSNAAMYLKQDYSTIYGHSHRLEVAYRTIPIRNGSRDIVAASPGCLARTDGYVPGVNYSIDERQNVVPRAYDWQQGVLAIHHNERNHHVTPMRIDDEGIQIYDRKHTYEKPE